jgi:hypothetical protein
MVGWQVHCLTGHIALYAFGMRLPTIQHHFDLDHGRTVSMPIAVSATQLRGRENGKRDMPELRCDESNINSQSGFRDGCVL